MVIKYNKQAVLLIFYENFTVDIIILIFYEHKVIIVVQGDTMFDIQELNKLTEKLNQTVYCL